MANNGMNVNGEVKKSLHSIDIREQIKNLSPEQKINIDFKVMQSDKDAYHLSVDEVLRSQVDAYLRTGELPAGKTLAEFLMDVQKAVEKYAGDDKQLNIDEYTAMVKSGVEMARPSQDQETKIPQQGYKEPMPLPLPPKLGEALVIEPDDASNISQTTKYPASDSDENVKNARAEANQKQIDEIAEMKKQAQAEDIAKENEEPKQYRAEDEKSADARNSIAKLKTQLIGPNTLEGYTAIEREIDFYQSFLDSNGYAP